METVTAKYDGLRKAWDGGKYDKVGQMLREMKTSLTLVSASFLPLASSDDDDKKCLLVTREVLEIGAQYSIHIKDVPAFERYMARYEGSSPNTSADNSVLIYHLTLAIFLA